MRKTNSEMRVRCQHCARKFRAFYWLTGMRVPCPFCRQDTLLNHEWIVGAEASGWAVTFLNFVQLAQEPYYVDTTLPLLHTLGYTFLSDQPLCFRDASGKTLSAEEVHTRIQNDADKQYRLYQTAMSLWWG